MNTVPLHTVNPHKWLHPRDITFGQIHWFSEELQFRLQTNHNINRKYIFYTHIQTEKVLVPSKCVHPVSWRRNSFEGQNSQSSVVQPTRTDVSSKWILIKYFSGRDKGMWVLIFRPYAILSGFITSSQCTHPGTACGWLPFPSGFCWFNLKDLCFFIYLCLCTSHCP